MTSVRRMVSAIAGVSLNHRFLEHISRTGYFLPRKVLALAYNTKGTEMLNYLWTKRKKNQSRTISSTTLCFFPCTILASLTYLSGLRPRSPPRVGLVYHVFSFVVDGIFLQNSSVINPFLPQRASLNPSHSIYLLTLRLKYNRIMIPSIIRKYYLFT